MCDSSDSSVENDIRLKRSHLQRVIADSRRLTLHLCAQITSDFGIWNQMHCRIRVLMIK